MVAARLSVLTGNYSRALDGDGAGTPAETRKSLATASGALSERGLRIAEVVKQVAHELETSAPRVALAWTLLNPAVTAPIIGARTLAQLEEDPGALELELGAPQRARLEEASAIELCFPHELLARRPTIRAPGGAGDADAWANAS